MCFYEFPLIEGKFSNFLTFKKNQVGKIFAEILGDFCRKFRQKLFKLGRTRINMLKFFKVKLLLLIS